MTAMMEELIQSLGCVGSEKMLVVPGLGTQPKSLAVLAPFIVLLGFPTLLSSAPAAGERVSVETAKPFADVTEQAGVAFAMLNDGHGRFTTAAGVPPTEIHLPSDINEDGRIDLQMTWQDGGAK